MTTCWIDCPLPTDRHHPLAVARRAPARPPAAPPTHPVRPVPVPPARRVVADNPLVPARLGRLARRLAVALLGTVAVLAGVAMLVLPGPGLVTIALGFGILGREYAWAARVSAGIRARVVATGDSVREAFRRP